MRSFLSASSSLILPFSNGSIFSPSLIAFCASSKSLVKLRIFSCDRIIFQSDIISKLRHVKASTSAKLLHAYLLLAKVLYSHFQFKGQLFVFLVQISFLLLQSLLGLLKPVPCTLHICTAKHIGMLIHLHRHVLHSAAHTLTQILGTSLSHKHNGYAICYSM